MLVHGSVHAPMAQANLTCKRAREVMYFHGKNFKYSICTSNASFCEWPSWKISNQQLFLGLELTGEPWFLLFGFFFISLVAKLKSGLAAHRLIFKSGGCWYHRGSLACDEIKISCPSSERYGWTPTAHIQREANIEQHLFKDNGESTELTDSCV